MVRRPPRPTRTYTLFPYTTLFRSPGDGSGECDCGHEVFDVAIEAGGDAPPVLEPAEHPLDDVALSVDGLVVVVLDFAVPARRDDGLGAACFEPFAQGLAVIALVGDEFGGRRHRRDEIGRAHTSALQSLMRIASAVFCSKKTR